MNITSKEIAELCGVSRGTVDRALNNRPGINPETKDKIMKVAEQLGYRPHFLAQSLVKGKTMSIGVVIFDINNRLFPQLIHAMDTRAREHRYFLYLALTDKDPETERECIRNLADRKVDGIVLLSVNKGKEFEKYVGQFNIPVVTIGNRVGPTIPYVWINDRKAMQDSVSFLVAKGYEEIIYVSPPIGHKESPKTNLYTMEQRLLGFKESVKRAKGVSSTIVTSKDYYAELEQLIRSSRKRKVILCTSDIYALRIMQHLKQAGVSIPGDVGLMGFDDIDTLEFVTPSLSTVSFSSNEIGRLAIDSLIQAIAGEDAEMNTVIGHRVVERQST